MHYAIQQGFPEYDLASQSSTQRRIEGERDTVEILSRKNRVTHMLSHHGDGRNKASLVVIMISSLLPGHLLPSEKPKLLRRCILFVPKKTSH